jgi:hypothetical protein
VIREYASDREHFEDVAALVARMVERHRRASSGAVADDEHRAIAELDLDIARREDLAAARYEASGTVPLDRLCRALELSSTERRVLWVLSVLELDASVRQHAATLLESSSHPTFEMLEAMCYRDADRQASMEQLSEDGKLFRFCLAASGDNDRPWLSRRVRVAPRVLEMMMSPLRLDPEVARAAALVADPVSGTLLVDERLRALADDTLRRHRDELGGSMLVIAGPRGSGRGSLACAAAKASALPALVVRAQALPHDRLELARTLRAIQREAILFGAALVVRDLDALAGDTERAEPDRIAPVVAQLSAHPGPVAATATSVTALGEHARLAVLVELGVPDELVRATLWQRALGAGQDEVARAASERYRITGGLIERAAAFARVQASARKTTIELDDIRRGIRGQLDGELATLGRRVEWKQTWADVVLPDDVLAELNELIGRIRHRRRVLDDWGFGRKVARGTGVSALFSGPPGTGKTMVAGLIARELELDLYQIDASRMVSKWIGETEKNLARLFDAAAAGHVVLLFDEADSLFAKRTEVKSSTDRYANLEVNYLLQRMEAFEGITILTTNLESSVDEAFKRRLAFRVAFPVPESEERERLWQALLPSEAAVAADIDFALLADKFEMTGGYIRNAVMRAAFLAAADGGAIAMRHLQRAAVLEYTAMGKIAHTSAL